MSRGEAQTMLMESAFRAPQRHSLSSLASSSDKREFIALRSLPNLWIEKGHETFLGVVIGQHCIIQEALDDVGRASGSSKDFNAIV